MQFRAAVQLLFTNPTNFVRRVGPALSWRLEQAWEPVGRSDLRRAGAGRAVWAARSASGVAHHALPRTRPLLLRVANVYASPPRELAWFADEVAELSAGAIRVGFVNTWPTTDNPREETATVAAVMRDQADLGWAGTRAFGCLGVRSLDPLQTPFLLEDYGALETVCRDDVSAEMMEPLERLGLVGLAVLPGPRRKPFSFSRRLLAPRDYEGARLRTHESLVAASTYRALGAQAVTLSNRQMATEPATLVDGLDLQTEALASWGLRGSITFNVNLWPRTIAIVASRKSYVWLGVAEQEVLREASRRTLERALAHLTDQDQRDRDALPATVTAIFADDEELAALHKRVEPVRAELQNNPETASFLERIESLVTRSRGVVAS